MKIHETNAWQETCVTRRMPGKRRVSRDECLARDVCHETNAWEETCVTRRMPGKRRVSRDDCIAWGVCLSVYFFLFSLKFQGKLVENNGWCTYVVHFMQMPIRKGKSISEEILAGKCKIVWHSAPACDAVHQRVAYWQCVKEILVATNDHYLHP